MIITTVNLEKLRLKHGTPATLDTSILKGQMVEILNNEFGENTFKPLDATITVKRNDLMDRKDLKGVTIEKKYNFYDFCCERNPTATINSGSILAVLN